MKRNTLFILITLSLFGIFFISTNVNVLAQVGTSEVEQTLTAEQELEKRVSKMDRLGKFLTESVVTIAAVIIFLIFFGVAAYLALGVILLVFFGGMGGK